LDRFTQANRAAWNTWLARDVNSSHHQDVARFERTGSSLRAIEVEELGAEVAGKSLLHLQCNMGSETLSWARLGATVTGVDLADAAIFRARELAAATGLPARFIQSDLYALPATLDEAFDIVFMSYGILFWLADIPRWASIVARYVKPGGTFYIVDMHPFANLFDHRRPEPTGLNFQVKYPYADAPVSAQPTAQTTNGAAEQADVADGDAPGGEYCWNHGLGEVISALLAAGLRIEYLHEFPYQHYQQFPSLVRDDDGWWRWPTPENTMPLLFSLRATR
jgi:SAM-dependent methyltransferase